MDGDPHDAQRRPLPAGRAAADGLLPPDRRRWFEAYVGQVLVPALEPGDVVIMYNLSSHKRASVRKAGARTVSGLWSLIGKPLDLFQPQECANYFSC